MKLSHTRKYTLKQACGCTNCACGYVDRVTLEKEKIKVLIESILISLTSLSLLPFFFFSLK